MSHKTHLTTRRRQRIWADLTELEQAIARYERYIGLIPRHWARARRLLWRDWRAVSESPYAYGREKK